MNFSLSDAEELSPKNIQQMIVREIDQTEQPSDAGSYAANDYFPLYQMGTAKEIYHRQGGGRAPMQGSSLASESNIAGIEDLDEDEMSVTTLKEKISPEKAVNQELNNPQQILNIAEYIADSLRTDLFLSRSVMAWRGHNGVDGVLGVSGDSPHPDIPSDHVFTGTDFSTATNDVYTPFMNANQSIDVDGSALNSVGPITAVMSPEVFWDLKSNDDLESRFSGVRVQTIESRDDLSSVLPVNIDVIRTKTPRTNANGEYIDANGNVVSVDNAVYDNILHGYDGTNMHRNVVVGAFGQESALMPWFTDRLSDLVNNTPPGGDWSVDMSNGFLLQSWTQHDPAISWRKIAQEVGFEMVRGENFAVLNDV